MADVPQRIEGAALQAFLPHRGKMLLLSRVTSYDLAARTLCAEYDVRGDCIFYDGGLGGVPSWVSFEVMAQAVAALASIDLMVHDRLDEAAPGAILSVGGYTATTAVLRADTTARIRVQEDYRSDTVSRYVCALYAGADGRTAPDVLPSPDVRSDAAGAGPAVCATITVMAMPDMAAQLAARA